MIPVQFPQPQFKLKKEGEKRYVFDAIRKTWLLLTEEEWVRQNFVSYLIQVMNYPSSLIALEKEMFVNDLKKRFDILVYDKSHQPWMMVECKAPGVALSEGVLNQALRYNISIQVPYIIITNGRHTVGWQKNGQQMELLHALPLLS